jgi:hypothetical protein
MLAYFRVALGSFALVTRTLNEALADDVFNLAAMPIPNRSVRAFATDLTKKALARLRKSA